MLANEDLLNILGAVINNILVDDVPPQEFGTALLGAGLALILRAGTEPGIDFVLRVTAILMKPDHAARFTRC
jgi:hypothetical protein